MGSILEGVTWKNWRRPSHKETPPVYHNVASIRNHQ